MFMEKKPLPQEPSATPAPEAGEDKNPLPEEIGGSKKPEPTRYGDWEIGGKCVDF